MAYKAKNKKSKEVICYVRQGVPLKIAREFMLLT